MHTSQFTHYTHFSQEERVIIADMRQANSSYQMIADALGRSKSAVWEEVKRNHTAAGYRAHAAHVASVNRKHRARGSVKKKCPDILAFIEENKHRRWSPEILSVKLKQKYPARPETWVSHTTLYELIKEEKQAGFHEWHKYLPQGRRKRRKRYGSGKCEAKIKDRISIDKRPAAVDRKKRFGDWEGDTIVGKNHSGYIASFVERKSNYLVSALMKDKTPKRLNHSIRRRFRLEEDLPMRTLTLDNGLEFAGHQRLAEQLEVDIYFAHPYSSWERGLNEQVNGLLRMFFPKGTDFSKLTSQQVQKVARLINDRPRKKLGYRTPSEVIAPLRVRLQI